ncbi:hypothetical protein [Schumannella soli]|uniref:Porin n=1 Tax=Schumannella soli TaxID=2590779 RepID=A0A506Y9K7_9MICO|nr:hypothetical protein [Schumannella soli]TPW77788.1 hypothetical protein FJ657_03830 [Schumannella soli]
MNVKKITAAVGTVVAAAAVVALTAGPASAAPLNVYDRINFSGTLIGSGVGTTVDVPDNRTRSAKNGTSLGYSARNVTGPFSSSEVVYIPAGYQLGNFSPANDVVDHFDRVG